VTWLAPEAFGWAALAALLLLFYLLRPRRRRIAVSSLFLWRRDTRVATGSTFWQIVRRWLLLALQLLALATLVATLARPAWPARERARADLVLVIDASARMALAVDGTTAMDRIVDRAREFVDANGGDAAITVIRAADSPGLAVLRETDRGTVDERLRALRAGGEEADPAAALALAQTVLAAGAGGSIAVFSDTAFPAVDARLMDRAGLVAVGDPPPNVGLETVSRRRDRSGAEQVLATVGSTLDGAMAVGLVLLDGEEEIVTRTVQVPARGRTVQVVDVPVGRDVDRVVLRGTGLAPDGDDRVFLSAAADRPLAIQIVAVDPRVYERALPAAAGFSTTAVDPAAYVDENGADLVLFVGFVPETLPAASAIFIAPPNDNPHFPSDPTGAGVGAPVAARTELTAAVDLGYLQTRRIAALPVPDWAVADLFVGDRAGMFHGVREGRSTVVLGFDPELLGLDQRAAFPILIQNAVAWANPTVAVRAGGALRPGQTVEIRPHPAATRVAIEGSDGETFAELAVPFPGTLPPLVAAGQYRVRQYAGERLVAEEVFGASPAFELTAIGAPRTAPPALPAVTAELDAGNFAAWPWFAALALALMAAEWAWFHRSRAASR
jgi:hypothetical protein